MASSTVLATRTDPPELHRVAEVLIEPTGGDEWGYGSGYEVAHGFVLTSAHVLAGASAALLRFDGGGPREREVGASVIWRTANLDLALLRFATDDRADGPVVHFADPARMIGEIPFVAVGFPHFKRQRLPSGAVLRDSQQIDGVIPLAANVKSGHLALETRAHPPEHPAGTSTAPLSPWKGMSGAAVFSRGSVVGVISIHRLPEGGASLTALRIAAINGPGVSEEDRQRFWQLLGIEHRELPVLRSVALGTGGGTPVLRHRLTALLKRHEVFGGRDEMLRKLTQSVTQRPSGYTFVTGRSGFGKTALLANWVVHREQLGEPTVYHFISRVDRTADEQQTLKNLCQQLQAVYRTDSSLPDDLADLRAVFATLVSQAASSVVIVLDGLDEAEGWTPGPDLFAPLPDGVFVILSAREMADRDWPTELALPLDTEIVRLGRLDRSHIADLLTRAEAPELLRDATAIETLEKKSAGDPYYLRLVVEDIERGRLRTRAQLEAAPKGLRGLLDRWWQEVSAAGEDAVRQLFGYLLVAKAPLTRADLVDIDAADALDGWTIDRALALAGRHVVGDADEGYSLAHARFAEYLAGRGIAGGDPSPRERLLAFCSRWRDGNSSYPFRYYTLHLLEDGADDELLGLVNDPDWEAAQLRHDPSGAGFLADLAQAWEVARRRSRHTVAADHPAESIGLETWCALATATVHSRLSGIPAELLRQLLSGGRWNANAVLAAIKHMSEPNQRAEALSVLAAELPADNLGEAVAIGRALPLETQRQWPRLTALAALIPHLTGDEQRDLVRELFSLRHALSDLSAWLRHVSEPEALRLLPTASVYEAIALAATGSATEPALRLLIELRDREGEGPMLEAMRSFPDHAHLAEVLSRLVVSLESDGVRAALGMALEVQSDTVDQRAPSPDSRGSPRARIISELAPRLDVNERAAAERALDEVTHDGWRHLALLRLHAGDADAVHRVGQARSIADPRWRLNVLVGSIPLLTGAGREAAVRVTLEELGDAERDLRLSALTALARDLEASEAERALELVDRDAILDEAAARAAVALAGRLPEDRRRRFLVAAAQRLSNGDAWDTDGVALRTLVASLPQADADAAVARAIEGVRGVKSWEATQRLVRLARSSRPEWVRSIREAVLELEDPGQRLEALAALLMAAPDEQCESILDAGLAAARALDVKDVGLFDSSRRAEGLLKLVPHAPSRRAAAILEEALSAAQVVADDALALRVEAALLPSLPEARRRDVLGRLDRAEDSDDAVRVISSLRPPFGSAVAHEAIARAKALPVPHAGTALALLYGLLDSEPHRETVRAAFVEVLSGAVLSVLQHVGADAIPEPLLADVFEVAVMDVTEQRSDAGELASVIVALMPYAGQALRRRLVEVTIALPAEPAPAGEGRPVSIRGWVLQRVAALVDAEEAVDAMAAAYEIPEPAWAVGSALALAARLPEPTRETVVAQLAELATEQHVVIRSQIVGGLLAAAAPEVAGRIVADAYAALREAPLTEEELARGLAELADGMTPQQATEALAASRGMQNPALRAATAAALIPRMTEQGGALPLTETLADIRVVEAEEERCEMLARLASFACGADQVTIVEDALAAAEALGDEGLPFARRVVEAVQLSDEHASAFVLGALHDALQMDRPARVREAIWGPTRLTAPVTGDGPPFDPDEPVGTMRVLPSGATGISANSQLVAVVGGDVIIDVVHHREDQLPSAGRIAALESALTTLRAADWEAWADAAALLLQPLPCSRGVLALVEAEMGSQVDHAIVLHFLAPPLPRWFAPRPSSRRARRETDRSAIMLAVLVPKLANLEPRCSYGAWNSVLSGFAGDVRPSLLVDLRLLAPLAARLAGSQGADDVVNAVRIAEARWP